MKKLFNTMFLAMVVVIVSSCGGGKKAPTGENNERTVLTGKVLNPSQNEIYLDYYTLSDDSAFPASVTLDSLGAFRLELNLPKDGIVSLDAGAKNGVAVYLWNGENIHIEFNAETMLYKRAAKGSELGTDVTYSGNAEATSVNNLMYELTKAQNSVYYLSMGVEEEEWKEVTTQILTAMNSVITNYEGKVPARYSELAKREREYYTKGNEKDARLNFYFSYIKEKSKNESEAWDTYGISYMKNAYAEDFNKCYASFVNADSLDVISINFNNMLGDYISHLFRSTPDAFSAEQAISTLNVLQTGIKDDKIRDYFMYRDLSAIATVISENAVNHFAKLCKDTTYVARLKALQAKGITNGSAFPEFDAKDIHDNSYSMIHLLQEHKPIYIDCWASWCGPCKAQFPFLHELEQEYKDKVTFVAFSFDEAKDKETWVNIVKDKKLGGFQLMVDGAFNSTLAKRFALSSIPRFMILDKDGKIINIDAPKPSDKEAVRKALDAVIKSTNN